MNYETKIQESETRVFKVVFPNTTNHHNTMFGGKVMEMVTTTNISFPTGFSNPHLFMPKIWMVTGIWM